MFSDNINVSFGKTQERSYNLRVSTIKVMLNMNIPNVKPVPLQFNMLYHPDLEKGRYSAAQYSYPYFTNSVKYPMSVLSMKTYSDRVDFFFNKTRFNKICRKSGTNYIKYDEDLQNEDSMNAESAQERENADHNIKCMLILLLPIADEFTNVFQTSYDQYIKEESSPELYTIRNIDPINLLNPTWLPFYNYFASHKYNAPIQEVSYIKQGGTKYVVNGVIWANDIVNHPVYREFLSTFYEKNREKMNNRKKILKQLNVRFDTFRNTIEKYKNYDVNESSGVAISPNSTTAYSNVTVFKVMINHLLHNVEFYGTINATSSPEKISSILDKGHTDIEEAIKKIMLFPNDMNQKEVTKRETISKIASFLLKIHILVIQSTPITDADLKQIVDHIVNAYVAYTLYNEGVSSDLHLTLKDTNRIFVELYNSSIFLKSIQMVDDFLNNRIRKFDMSEKNEDDTPKSKIEIDIIRSVNKNFPYYIQLNDDILSNLKNVIEPARRSSNSDLQTFLMNIFKPPAASDPGKNEQYALIDVYNKYITNMRKSIDSSFVDKYMYVGVSTVVGNNDKNTGVKETPEIYVYVNVVKKDDYEKSEDRMCVINDDFLSNKLKQLLYTNTMMDNTFPEVNPYRSFRYLNGSDQNSSRIPNVNRNESDDTPSNEVQQSVQNKSNGGNGRFNRKLNTRSTIKYSKRVLRNPLNRSTTYKTRK